MISVIVCGHVSSSEVLPCLFETLWFPFRIIKTENYYFTSGFLKFGLLILKNLYPIISDFWNIFKSKCNFPFKTCFSLVSSPENIVSLIFFPFLFFFAYASILSEQASKMYVFLNLCVLFYTLYAIFLLFWIEMISSHLVIQLIYQIRLFYLFVGSYRERLKWRCMIGRLETYLQGEPETTTHLSRTQTINANYWHLLIIYAMVTEIS